MTRKDYVLLAAALADARSTEKLPKDYALGLEVGRELCAMRIADALANDNPRFDSARFLRDAGVQS